MFILFLGNFGIKTENWDLDNKSQLLKQVGVWCEPAGRPHPALGRLHVSGRAGQSAGESIIL